MQAAGSSSPSPEAEVEEKESGGPPAGPLLPPRRGPEVQAEEVGPPQALEGPAP